MDQMEFSVPCLFGLEGLAGDELKRMGLENVRVENGQSCFPGTSGPWPRPMWACAPASGC